MAGGTAGGPSGAAAAPAGAGSGWGAAPGSAETWARRPVAWVGRAWAVDWVRGPILFLYYLGLIYLLIHVYGNGQPHVTPPFIYQGF